MLNMIKCVVSDLDGTLLYKGKLSDNNYKAIRLLKENDMQFVIATGRNIQELDILDLKGMSCPKVLVNGSLVLDEKDNVISLVNFEKETLEKMLKVINEYDVGYILYTKDIRYIVKKDTMLYSFRNSMNVFGNNFFDAVKEMNDDILHNISFCKVEILDGEHFAMLEEINKKLGLIKGLSCTSSDPNNIEVIAENVSKYHGIEVLMEKYDIKDNEIAIFGDSDNDLSMFENVEESYAMGNANDRIKSLAKHITADCKDDGFYKAVIKIIDENKNLTL